MAETSFTHRIISGWIIDFSSIAAVTPWPSIALDQRLTADLLQAFDRAQTAGYTSIILWGLLAGRSWNSSLPDTVSPARKQQVLQIMEEVRRRGMKMIMGLGLYSWGFEEIIAAHPELDGGAPDKMCGSRPESWDWMQRVIDFVFEEYDPDGVSMQSSDQGRCPCDACQEMGSLEYHAKINEKVSAYIRSRWPEKFIHISTWGMDLSNPDEAKYVQQMTQHADALNDVINSAARYGRQNRKALIHSLKCAYGTEQGFWVDPPYFWDKDRWFLPFSLRNVPYWQSLKEDGADAIERYILSLVNPGAEVGFLFDGWMLQDLRRDPIQTLQDALELVFEPRSTAARQGLLDIWQTVENGFIDHLPRPAEARTIHPTNVHYDHPNPADALKNRPEYLMKMKPASRSCFGDSLQGAIQNLVKIRAELGQPLKAAMLERCMRRNLADVESVRAYKS
jgi:hypothetical protein